MKSLFLIVLLLFEVGWAICQRPEWTFGRLPKADNDTYVYQYAKGPGDNYRMAYNNALVKIIEDYVGRVGLKIDRGTIKDIVFNGAHPPFQISYFIKCEFECKEDGRICVYLLAQVAKSGNIAPVFTDYDCAASKLLRKSKRWYPGGENGKDDNKFQMGMLLQNFQSFDFEENNYNTYGIEIGYLNYSESDKVGAGVNIYATSSKELKKWEFGLGGLLSYGTQNFSFGSGFGLGYNFEYGPDIFIPVSFNYRSFYIQYKISFYKTPKNPKNKNESGSLSDNSSEDMDYSTALECYNNGGFCMNIGGVMVDSSVKKGWRPLYKADLSHQISLGFTIKYW